MRPLGVNSIGRSTTIILAACYQLDGSLITFLKMPPSRLSPGACGGGVVSVLLISGLRK
jgi:hypothetical protein